MGPDRTLARCIYHCRIVVSAMAKSQRALPTGHDPEAFLAAVPDEARREDARTLCRLLADWTGEPPAMWGTSIVGFGSYHYRYDSGHEGTAALVGFSPRKANLVLYLVGGAADRYRKLLERLGPHKTGKGCVYLKRSTTSTVTCCASWSSAQCACIAGPIVPALRLEATRRRTSYALPLRDAASGLAFWFGSDRRSRCGCRRAAGPWRSAQVGSRRWHERGGV
jgi:hypothetical protein